MPLKELFAEAAYLKKTGTTFEAKAPLLLQGLSAEAAYLKKTGTTFEAISLCR
ncbi:MULTISPECIES: hypothetical protein [unclassified Pantoea]|uniref:hypothetical protein n=1 Tax=unclassified Pantoea TaxID=2630326 RepID=UPI00301DFD36